MSWNVNGVRAVAKRGDLQWLWSSDADIVCLQETKCAPEQVPDEIRAPPGWRSAWSAGERKGYSGTATFVRAEHPLEVVARGFGVERFDNEGRIVVTDHGRFLLFNIYFPNGGTGPTRQAYKMDFLAAFAAHVNALVASGRDVVVCGDFNIAHRPIDVALPEQWADVSGFLPDERAWFDAFLASGWIDTFRSEHGDRPQQFTWWETRTNARPDNRGWRIDYFVLNRRFEDHLVDAWISPHIAGSDHCPVGVELDVGLPRVASLPAASDETSGPDEEAGDDDNDDEDLPAWRLR